MDDFDGIVPTRRGSGPPVGEHCYAVACPPDRFDGRAEFVEGPWSWENDEPAFAACAQLDRIVPADYSLGVEYVDESPTTVTRVEYEPFQRQTRP